MRAALDGDRSAVDGLERRLRCVPGRLAFLDRRAGGVLDREDLRDLGQEVLVSLWMRLGDYTGEASLEAWARGFCVNGFRNAVRKVQRRARVLMLATSSFSDTAPVASSALDHEELQALFTRLEEDEARMIRLKCYEGLTFDEIGGRLGISANTAKTCYYRGIRRLAAGLGREGDSRE